MLFHAYLFAALSHSGRHERTTVCILLLCAGPIEGSSAAVRTVAQTKLRKPQQQCPQKKKSKFKDKNFEVGFSELMVIKLDLSKKSPSSNVHLAVGTPQCHDLD